MHHAARPRRATRRAPRTTLRVRLVFIALSLVVGLAVVALLEGALRLAGYGGYPPTFERVGALDDGSDLVFTTFAGPASYFQVDKNAAGSLNRDAFVMPKPARTFRVMIVGGSAAKGIPHPRTLAWSAFLREMLADLIPERDVEVINCGVTAIASYPVLGICTEALGYDPDLMIIWCGNNEFFGAYGVASTHSVGRSPTMIRIARAARALAITQWVHHLVTRSPDPTDSTLLEAMIGRDSIGPGDSARQDAARNLRTFVGDMIDRCAARRVPTIICLPPANERDMAPIGAIDTSALTDADRDALTQALELAAELLDSDPAGAETAARRAVAIMPTHAGAHHILGAALHAQSRFSESRSEFRAAIDLDPMPWRPPTACVDAIRTATAERYQPVCDLPATFEDASPGGSIGWELMADHVHPSLAGQELAARAVAGIFAEMPQASLVSAASADTLPDASVYFERLGANPYDDYAVNSAMRTLASVRLFRDSNPAFLAHFDEACRAFELTTPRPLVEALRAWSDQPTIGGERRPATSFVAQAFVDAGRTGDAAPYYRLARDAVTPYGTWELAYAYLALACTPSPTERDLRDADRFIERGEFLVAHSGPDAIGPRKYLGGLLQLRGRDAEAIPLLEAARTHAPESDRAPIDLALASAYQATGNPDRARAILEAGAAGAGQAGAPYRARLARDFPP